MQTERKRRNKATIEEYTDGDQSELKILNDFFEA